MIMSFLCKDTRLFYEDGVTRRFSAISKVAARKLAMLDAAVSLSDLRIPPSNCLEALSGDRAGQYSIRVNAQFRLCFRWKDGNAYDVESVDYH